jgi:hypothetical protein
LYKILRPSLVLLLAALLGGGVAFAQITEVPETVQPGHFLLEMDALSLTLNHDGPDKYTALGVATTLVTTGVTPTVDVQLGAEVFINQKIESGSFTDRRTGIGDVYARLKWKFFDHAGTAVALLPYIKVPTNSGGVGNDAVEGGLIVPWSTQLPTGLEVAAMGGVDFIRNPADNGYDTFLYASAYAKQPLVGGFGVYGEATVGKSSGGEPFAGTIGGGVTFNVTDHICWDYAVYKGVSNGAANWNHVLRFNFSF